MRQIGQLELSALGKSWRPSHT